MMGEHLPQFTFRIGQRVRVTGYGLGTILKCYQRPVRCDDDFTNIVQAPYYDVQLWSGNVIAISEQAINEPDPDSYSLKAENPFYVGSKALS